MNTKSFTLSYCKKHRNWWVTNCPDCMVDSNEESIKQVGRREVVEWIEKSSWTEWNGTISIDKPQNVLFDESAWQAKLKEWGL